VAHNHPSGCVDPSQADLDLTKKLLYAGRELGVPILDHLILGGGNYRSLRESTLLWNEYPQGD
jgi:DNA repair protein RadC